MASFFVCLFVFLLQCAYFWTDRLGFMIAITCVWCVQGIARTQSPLRKNYALESPTLVVIAEVNLTEVQWKGLTLDRLGGWSQFSPCQVSMIEIGSVWHQSRGALRKKQPVICAYRSKVSKKEKCTVTKTACINVIIAISRANFPRFLNGHAVAAVPTPHAGTVDQSLYSGRGTKLVFSHPFCSLPCYWDHVLRLVLNII